jgi:hypothetical protein
MKWPAFLLALLVGAEFAAAVRAFREQRFADAAAQFGALERAEGNAASPELLYDLAVSALAAGDATAAEIAAEKAAARGGPDWYGRRDFVLGAAAYQRCIVAETRADLPGAGPRPFDRAIAYAEFARDAWIRAAASQDDWPAARRNVERAILKIDALNLRREDAAKEAESKPVEIEEPPPPEPEEPEKPAPKPPEEPPAEKDLTAEELRKLVDRLAQRESEKTKVRLQRRDELRSRTERDW